MNNKANKINEPLKKPDKELYELLTKKILSGDYIFKRHRNKKKDKYENGREDWNYCIEGVSFDYKAIRIIISFEDILLPIITVMWI